MMNSSSCSRRLACVAQEAHIPTWRAIISVVTMVILHFLISMEQQAIPAFIPAEIKCNQSACLAKSSHEFKKQGCGCINMTMIEEGVLLGTLTGAAYLVAPFLTKHISSATSHVLVLVVGGLVWSGMVTFTALSTDYWKLVIARLGVGIGLSAAVPMTTSLSSSLFQSPATIHKVRKVFQVTAIIGTSCGYLLVLQTHVICWHIVFLILAPLGLAVSMATMCVVREPNMEAGQCVYKEELSTKELLSETLRVKPFVLLCIAVLLKSTSSYALNAWLATYYSHTFSLNPSEYGLKLGVVVLCGGVGGAVLGGFLHYKLKGAGRAVPALLVSLSLMVSTGCLAAALIVSTPGLSFGLLFLVYLTGEIWWDSAIAVTKVCFDSRLRGPAVSLCLSSGVVVGSIAGPMLVSGASYCYQIDEDGCDVIADPLLHIASACSGLAAILFLVVSLLVRQQTSGPSIEETIYLMYDTSDVDALSEHSYSEKNSSF